ncbi:MAG: glycosyl hydrolase [Ignavibacteriae bacterium]|nr:glycosyl hydrolase [Ignavibacteriota bacterium]
MNKKTSTIIILLIFSITFFAQESEKSKDTNKVNFDGLKWRSIGPAFTSGRIADIKVNPKNKNEYYVAVASGNIWKTSNWGTTFEPIFDKYGAYSIGCLAINPENPNVVWAGTGENNHQRALGYGDGVYKTIDGGKSWKNMGLKDSRQIGQIAIDPRNTNIVFVAAEGSVWGPGGDRGLYKTSDGGKTWKKVLDISKHTGVNNVIMDLKNPDIMYATSEQRRRHAFTKIGGGPESAVYKSVDAGETWEKIMEGLPKVDIGGMGIDISPANPEYIYLSVEAADDKGGFFRSTNRGATWEKMSDQFSSGQYFNEIYCDPINPEKVYLMDVYSKVTVDGGKTWTNIGIENRHVDDHAMWIDPNDNSHFMIGGDGGIYESFDNGKTFDFKENLPITQFYRVNVDNDYPFYNVFGGTQDNNSMGGPSRTISSDGIINDDWFITNGGDGFWTAVDPNDPNTVYAEAQYGNMVRYNKITKEAVDIRPEPGKDELTYKWNWDTPLFISPHKSTRIYCAANKVFKSEDRGNSWETISDDLTTQTDRNSWQVMDKFWSVDGVAKDKSTSLWGTIISLSESPIKENLLYAGTDDGLIQITEDAKTWRKSSQVSGVPEFTYVSDILPSKFDENIVFASFNNTKRDDFKPYIFKSLDKGKTWKSIISNLPQNGAVQTIEQDFVNPELLFVGTEFGFFFTNDGGKSWNQLKGDLPTISVKDVAIQKRENDLVIATFGRGFYILDNYSVLRNVDENTLKNEAKLFPVKDALWFIEGSGRYGQGTTYFKAKNPEIGATFTYYLKEVPKTLKEIRKEKEKELFKDGKKIPQPTNDELLIEKNEISPYLIFTISDENKNVIRKISKSAKKGINREVWNLRYESPNPLTEKDKFDPNAKPRSSTLVLPGKYKATLSIISREGEKILSEPMEFNIVPIDKNQASAEKKELVSFQKKVNELSRTITGTENFLKEMISKVDKMKQVILLTPGTSYELLNEVDKIKNELNDISLKFSRQTNFPSTEENPPSPVTINERLDVLRYTHYRSTEPITKKEKVAYDVLAEEFPQVYEKIKNISKVDIFNLEMKLENLDTPAIPGKLPELKLK